MHQRSTRPALLLAAAIALASSPARATDPPPPSTTRPSTASTPRPARGEIELGYGLDGGASDWSGDGVIYPSAITLGFRLFGVITPYVGGALGYGIVDERLLTRLTIGVAGGYTIAGRFRPRAFVAMVHQHEESLAAVAEQPFGAVLGIGTGIRHRAGVHFGVGFDFVLWHNDRADVSVGPDVSAMYLTYSSGPTWYVVGGATLLAHVRVF